MQDSHATSERGDSIEFSYVMTPGDYIIRDATIELLEKIRTRPGLDPIDIERLDLALGMLRAMPAGSVPFDKNAFLVVADWPPTGRDGFQLRHHVLVVFEAGKIWVAFAYNFLPYSDPIRDGRGFFDWNVIPADVCDIVDHYREHAHMEGVLPYHAAVRAFDPMHPETDLEFILDDEWDEDLNLADPRKDLAEIPMPVTAEETLRSLVSGERPRRGMLRLPVPQKCNMCRAVFADERLLVDGRLNGGLEWADLCARCALLYGAGIGPGDGQLYERQADGSWSCIGGLAARKKKQPYRHAAK